MASQNRPETDRPWLFKKGESGNPGGRPKSLANAIREQTQDGAEIVTFMLDVFRGKRRSDLKQKMEAATWLADRGFGKPIQTTEISGPGGGPIQTLDLTKLSNEEFEQLDALARKAISAPAQ